MKIRKTILIIALAMMATSAQAGPADDDQFDLTPRQFSVPQPDPDKYFDTYNRTAARYPHGNTAVRKALVTMYNQANVAFDNAEAAWNQQREAFEAEEGKRLMVESGKASRAAAEARRQLNEAHQDKAAALMYQHELTIRALNSADADRRQKELQDVLNRRHNETPSVETNKEIDEVNALAATPRDQAFECNDAWTTGVALTKIATEKQNLAEGIIKDFSAGKIDREKAIPAEIEASDALLAALDSADISLKFLIDNNCKPDLTVQLKAQLASNASALKDLREERKQFDTLRKYSGK